MKIKVWYDGAVWCARKRGFPGCVFADTEGEALSRASSWAWSHKRQGWGNK